MSGERERSPRRGAERDCTQWNIQCGPRAVQILNPIRAIMDSIDGKANPEKHLISLAQGDPTAYPHLRPGNDMVQAMCSTVTGGAANGYQPSIA